MAPRQSFFPAQSWTPTESGTYSIQVFVWASIDNPEALPTPLHITVNVSEKNLNFTLKNPAS